MEVHPDFNLQMMTWSTGWQILEGETAYKRITTLITLQSNMLCITPAYTVLFLQKRDPPEPNTITPTNYIPI